MYNNPPDEPHSNIEHSRRQHIDFYVKNYVSMCLCGENKFMVASTG